MVTIQSVGNFKNIYRMTTNFGEANIWQLAENLQLADFNMVRACFLK